MRTNSQTETYKDISYVDLYRIKSGGEDTTTTAAVAAGDATVTVADDAQLADTDPIFIIGDGGVELNAVKGAPALALPLLYKVSIAQALGARVVEAERVALGFPTDQGLQFSGSLQNQAIMSAISRLPIGYQPGPAEISLNFALLGFNIENLQLMFGQEESVSGAGTAADPYQGAVLGVNVGLAGTRCLRIGGHRDDGKQWSIDFLDFKHEISGNVQLALQAASYPVAGKCTGIIKRIWT